MFSFSNLFILHLQGSVMLEVRYQQPLRTTERTLFLQVRTLTSTSGTIGVRKGPRLSLRTTGLVSISSQTAVQSLFLGPVEHAGAIFCQVHQENLHLLIILLSHVEGQSNRVSHQPITCHWAMEFSLSLPPRDPPPGQRRSFLVQTHWPCHLQNVNHNTSFWSHFARAGLVVLKHGVWSL